MNEPAGRRSHGSAIHVGEVAGVAGTLVEGLNRIGFHSEQRLLPTPAARSSLPVKVFASGPRATATARIRSELRSSGAIAHVHYATSGLWFIGRHPLVVHCHGTDVRAPDAVRRTALGRIFAASDLLVAATPDLLDWLPDGARYLPNPVDVDTFDCRIAPSEATRDVLVFSALTDVKGALRTLEIVGELKRSRPELTVTAIAHGTHVAAFEEQGVEMVGFMAARELPGLLNDHRIVLGQRRLGVAGMSELQAMACGRPVVMPLSDDVEESLLPPVLDERDTRLVAAQVVELLDDTGRLDRLGAEARSWTIANHGTGAVSERLAGWYCEIA